MKNISRRLEASVTNLRNKPFLRARFKLSIFYIIAAFIVILVFNLLSYAIFYLNVSDIPENQEAVKIFQTVLAIASLVIMILTAILSYYFAGQTLKPVDNICLGQEKFVADAAHELRTPLAVMKTGAEAMLSGKNEKGEYRKFLRDHLDELNYLSVIVDDLLFLAITDNPKRLEFARFNLSALVNRQTELMKLYAEKKDIIIQNNIQGDYYMLGNKMHIKRLLVNIIKNAIEYNKPQGKVILTLQKKYKYLELKITDTGIGISKNDLGRIFDRFYKADRARGEHTGAGLGLSIVQEIIQAHRGKISIKSELSKGTEVAIFFRSA